MASLTANDAAAADPDESLEPYPSAAAGWWALFVFTVALILSYLDRQILSLLVEPVRGELGISDTQMSLLLGAAFAVLYAIAGLPLGRIADIYPRRRLIVIGILVWSAATLACGLAAAYGQLFIARVCVGIGEAALLPAAVSMLADYFSPSRRGTAIGILILGAAAGNAIALMIGGVLLNALHAGVFDWVPGIAGLSDWRAALVLISIPGIPVALLVLTVRDPVRRGGGAKRPNMAVVRAAFRERARLLVPIYASLAAMGIASFAMITWMPAIFLRKFNMEAAEVGTSLGLHMLAGGIFGSVISGMIGDALTKRWGLRGRLGGATIFSLLAIIGGFVALAGSPAHLLVLAGIMTAGTAGAMTISAAAVQDIANSAIRGVAASLISMMGTLVGMGVAPTLVATLTDKVFADPAALDRAVSTVAVPFATLSAALLLYAFLTVRQHGGSGYQAAPAR
jgi:MFS family permease